MSKFSIVTTSLNHGAFLNEALDSVRLQEYGDLEHIVLDGGSTDGTLALLRAKDGAKWKHLRWVSEPDGGQTQAMNKGLRLASGDVIGWLNSDDRYRPDCLKMVARVFAENPDVDVIYGDYTFMKADGAHLRVRREINFNLFVLLYHRVLYIPTTSAFFRRRIFDEGNWLDESMQYAMDHEFCVRLAMKGYRFKHLPALLADFRLHPDSKTCMMASRQLAESRLTMLRYSPLTLGIKSDVVRAACLGTLQTIAALRRYTEKLLRGYYLPDYIVGRERPVR